ncbi:MAG: PAS domain S-box protein, partial [Cytophagaceae bacterium]|nr:PAS domain S-box protein [Gemmatimonadaceae bacterium]
PVLGETFPLITLYGAIAAAVWIGGARPAVVAAIIGFVACDWFFVEPRGQFVIDASKAVAMAAYAFTCAVIIGIGHAMRGAQRRADEGRQLLQLTLRSIGDGVITTDAQGCVTSMNAVAEELTGWAQTAAKGQPLETIFNIVHEETRARAANPATRAISEGIIVGLANHTILIARDGTERHIDDSAAPIRDAQDCISGCVLIFRDVSKHRRMEQAKAGRLEAARLLAAIVESSDDAIISKSLDGIIQSWNAAAERLFGYSSAQAVGRHIALVIPPDRLFEEDEIIAKLRVGERIDHAETERVHADGRRIVVSLTISPIRDDSGVVIGASKIVRDVGREREAEVRERELLAATAAANAKARGFFEQGAVLAAIVDVDGTVREANRFSLEGCGYTRQEVVGRKFWEGPWFARSDAIAGQLQGAVAQAAKGQTFRGEFTYHLADGSERTADLIIQPITDASGHVIFLAPTGTDITERKRAEEDRESFATLIENSTDFIAIFDLQGRPFFVNRAGLAMVGLESIAQACTVSLRDFFFPGDQSYLLDTFVPLVLEQGHGEVEVRFRNFVTGDARWMAYKVLVLTDAAGAPVALATVSQDVTGRRLLEDNLRHLAADLSEAGRRKDEFLAMLAHELRNPLAPMSNAVHVLRMKAGDAPAVAGATAVLQRQVGQMTRLVDDLLDVNRITQGRIELRRERVELAPIVDQAVEATRALYDHMEHDLTVTLPQQPVVIYADPTRLTQVIGNLLNNAYKFTERRGKIRLSAERQGTHVVIRVNDSGIGIAAGDLAGIFELFTQVDTALERSRDGLGIGLTLVKTLVEMHDGTVEASSEGPGQGSQFVVRLPLASAAPEAAPTPEPNGARPAHARRVLIVDDNEDGATSMAMLVTLAGHEAFAAHDGERAVEEAERLLPDIVLLDIGLPKLNGYEVCRRIRATSWGARMHIVAVTGWGQEADRERSTAAGFDAHLVKPVSPEALMKLLAARA